MGINYTLNRHRFLNAVTGSAGGASVSTPFPCDYRFSGNQARSIFFSMNAADTITIQASPDFGASAASTWYTVTALTGATNGVVGLNADVPYASLRVSLTGANGAATVEGLV